MVHGEFIEECGLPRRGCTWKRGGTADAQPAQHTRLARWVQLRLIDAIRRQGGTTDVAASRDPQRLLTEVKLKQWQANGVAKTMRGVSAVERRPPEVWVRHVADAIAFKQGRHHCTSDCQGGFGTSCDVHRGTKGYCTLLNILDGEVPGLPRKQHKLC